MATPTLVFTKHAHRVWSVAVYNNGQLIQRLERSTARSRMQAVRMMLLAQDQQQKIVSIRPKKVVS